MPSLIHWATARTPVTLRWPLILLSGLALVSLASCDAGTVSVRAASTNALAIRNRQPKVTDVAIEALGAGQWQLRATVVDPDGHALSYDWQADAGRFEGEGALVRWVAPAIPGRVPLRLVVRDGHGGQAQWSGAIDVDAVPLRDVPTSDATPSPSPVPVPSSAPRTDASGGGVGGDNGGASLPDDVDLPSYPPVPTPAPTASTLASGELSSIGQALVPGYLDGAEVLARFHYPHAVTTDAHGHVYIADAQNHAVRRRTFWGLVQTIVGFGVPGYQGDGGTAALAQLHTPKGLAFDRQGNLYVADTGNHAVRKVMPYGKISTIAGTGEPGFSGDGGLSHQARLHTPTAIAIDAQDNLYIADSGNHRIRRVHLPTYRISTFAGTGQYGAWDGPALTAKFGPNGPSGLAVNAIGDLLVADTYNHAIRRIRDGNVTTIVGRLTENPLVPDGADGYTLDPALLGNGGHPLDARLLYPQGIALDEGGALYIADQGSNQIRKVTPGLIERIAGDAGGQAGDTGDGGPAVQARLNGPTGVAVSADLIVIADWGNHRVRMLQR